MLAPDAAPAGTLTTEPATTVAPAPEPVWHDPHETLLGPGALVLETLTVDEGIATLGYRVEGITPARSGLVFEEDSVAPVAPEVFVLEAGSERHTASAVRVGSTQVEFEVGDGFDRASVTGITVERVWLRHPYRWDVELPAARGASITLDAHVTVSVEAVVAQADSTLVNLDTTHLADDFVAGRSARVWVTGRGPGWTSGNRQLGTGIGGSTGVQLTWHTPDIPDPMPLSVTAPQWLPREVSIPLDLGGLNLGR